MLGLQKHSSELEVSYPPLKLFHRSIWYINKIIKLSTFKLYTLKVNYTKF